MSKMSEKPPKKTPPKKTYECYICHQPIRFKKGDKTKYNMNWTVHECFQPVGGTAEEQPTPPPPSVPYTTAQSFYNSDQYSSTPMNTIQAEDDRIQLIITLLTQIRDLLTMLTSLEAKMLE